MTREENEMHIYADLRPERGARPEARADQAIALSASGDIQIVVPQTPDGVEYLRALSDVASALADRLAYAHQFNRRQ